MPFFLKNLHHAKASELIKFDEMYGIGLGTTSILNLFFLKPFSFVMQIMAPVYILMIEQRIKDGVFFVKRSIY